MVLSRYVILSAKLLYFDRGIIVVPLEIANTDDFNTNLIQQIMIVFDNKRD